MLHCDEILWIMSTVNGRLRFSTSDAREEEPSTSASFFCLNPRISICAAIASTGSSSLTG